MTQGWSLCEEDDEGEERLAAAMTRNPHSRRVRNCKGGGGFRIDGEDDEGEEHAKSTELTGGE